MVSCIWFRNDLRVQDNPALSYLVRRRPEQVIAVYCVPFKTWDEHKQSAVKTQFIFSTLAQLSADLWRYGIALKILAVDDYESIPQALLDFCNQYGVSAVYANQEILLDEVVRDNAVVSALESHNISCNFDTYRACVVHPSQILKKDQSPYKVYTPFRKAWLERVSQEDFQLGEGLSDTYDPVCQPDEIGRVVNLKAGAFDDSLWPPGEVAALERMRSFVQSKIEAYQKVRDFPFERGTSMMSPYLACGAISPAQCVGCAVEQLGPDVIFMSHKDTGAGCWISEVIWREFYAYIAFHFPRVVKHLALKPQYQSIPWHNNKHHFEAWCQGKTGFPLVDAAMRQLLDCGWMHNRLRMVVAMFLTKTLFIDWRWGEDFFMRHLIDGDFSSNNGGWQWSASTGTDAAPYFRIFNPTTQSVRFDPQGEFIKKYCKELSSCDAKDIHDPTPEQRSRYGYPMPIVDYKHMRQEVIQTFKAHLS